MCPSKKDDGRHVCMNCMSPMHGGLCGYEFPDGIPDKIDMRLLTANLSAHGQDIAVRNSNDSLICFICFNGAIFAHSCKTPSSGSDPLDATDPVCNSCNGACDPLAASDQLHFSQDGANKEGSGQLFPDKDVDHGLGDDGVDDDLDDMDEARVPTIPSFGDCEEEFSKQFYFNVEKRLMATKEKIPNYRPLFKTYQEALDIIALLTEWDKTGSGKRKCVSHTRAEYRVRDKYEVIKANGTHTLRHHDTGLRVAICEDMFRIVFDAHVGIGHAQTARNVLNELKNE